MTAIEHERARETVERQLVRKALIVPQITEPSLLSKIEDCTSSIKVFVAVRANALSGDRDGWSLKSREKPGAKPFPARELGAGDGPGPDDMTP